MQQVWAEAKEEGTESCLVRTSGNRGKSYYSIQCHRRSSSPYPITQAWAGSGVDSFVVAQGVPSSTERNREWR